MKRRYLVIAEVLLLAGVCVWLALSLVERGSRSAGGINVKVQLRGARDSAALVRTTDGHYVYIVTTMDGRDITLSPEAFAQRIYDDRVTRSWVQAVLNVTSPVGFIWVTVGLAGQVLFTGRMIVQWISSEKRGESVVPPIFWWMSLVGATMLLVYFFWRKDPVGLLGQSVGWFVYVRNLWFIYRPSPRPAQAPA